jgi:arylsulfatase A-like enzyme
MIRRDFLKGTLAASALGGCGLEMAERLGSKGQALGGQGPNILIILVDEMRPPPGYPYDMPAVWQTNLPNMLALWQKSACFTNHFTAASDCSPSRATLVTGMYAQQHWLLTTRIVGSPQLQTAYPTYGSILSGMGYSTQWIGKWHLSDYPSSQENDNDCPPATTAATGNPLSAYGFSNGTCPDPIGISGQGATDDQDIAAQFVSWLGSDAPTSQAWCATVSLVNPHDIQWFWTGTDCSSCVPAAYSNPPSYGWDNAYFQALYNGNPCVNFADPTNPPSSPPGCNQPGLPSFQEQFAQQSAATIGPISWDIGTLLPSMPAPDCVDGGTTPTMPFNYWYKLLQLYLYMQSLVDTQIGVIMSALENNASFKNNTIVIFTSDHGEYAGAHGQRGKGGMAYDEGMRVPFSVYDPTGLYVADPTVVRTGLTSSVDFAALVATLANKGTTPRWLGATSYLRERFPMYSMLASPSAAGRPYVLYSTDEVFPNILPSSIPTHVLSYRTADFKFNAYSFWQSDVQGPGQGPCVINPAGQQFELYDYDGADAGQAGDTGEMNNVYCTNTALASASQTALLGSNSQGGLLASDLQATVDPSLVPAQVAAKAAYLAYVPVVQILGPYL